MRFYAVVSCEVDLKKLNDANSNLYERKITKPCEKFTQNRGSVQLHLIMNNLAQCIIESNFQMSVGNFLDG